MDELIEYTPIPLDTVVLGSVPEFDLYHYNRVKNLYFLYRAKKTPFTAGVAAKLLENRVSVLFVRNDEVSLYQHYVEGNLSQILTSDRIDSQEKAGIVYSSARNLMQEVMEHPTKKGIVKRSQSFVENTVLYITKDKDYFFNLINLTSHDYYTYTHSMNVCIYALSLARKIGGFTDEDMNILGSGALLHDIGKSMVPSHILLKKGALSDAEWDTMRMHPDNGVKLVKKSEEACDDAVFDIIRHHHEKIDGSGYPGGLEGENIPKFARIVCICDIFDALNTNRPYKTAADTFHSLQIMNEHFRGKLDPALLKTFITMFKLQ